MNEHAQALGRLGGLANKGKPKSWTHKLALSKALETARKRSSLTQDASKPIDGNEVKVVYVTPTEEQLNDMRYGIPKEMECALCRCRGTHKGYYNGVPRLFCSHHFKV